MRVRILPVLLVLFGAIAAADEPVAPSSAKPVRAVFEKRWKEAPTGETKEAIERGLCWLVRHQAKDGSWSVDRFSDFCAGDALCEGKGVAEYRVGVTALVALSLLGYGVLPGAPMTAKDEVMGADAELGAALQRALTCLCKGQQSTGSFSGDAGSKEMYNHALATWAVTEAYAVTGQVELRAAAQKGLDYLVAVQTPFKAWRYTPKSSENDTSATGWCVMALYAGRLAGLPVPMSAFLGAKGFIEEATNPTSHETGYMRREDAGVKVVAPGKNEDYANHPTHTAIALLVRLVVDGPKQDPVLVQAVAARLAGDLPVWSPEKKTNDFYYWYYGTFALGQLGKGAPQAGPAWAKAVAAALKPGQDRDKTRCSCGSWKGATEQGLDRWGFEGGTVAATALAVLTLETPTRYGPFPAVGSLPEALRPGQKPSSEALTPEERQSLEALIARLGGEPDDAQAAAADLASFGPRAATVLRAHLKDADPEIRKRVREILWMVAGDAPAAGDKPVAAGDKPGVGTRPPPGDKPPAGGKPGAGAKADPAPLSAEERRQVEDLISRLGYDSWLKAADALKVFGARVVPLLRTYLDDANANRRRHVRQLIQQITGEEPK